MKGSGHGLHTPHRSSWPSCRIPGLPALQDYDGGSFIAADHVGVRLALGTARSGASSIYCPVPARQLGWSGFRSEPQVLTVDDQRSL